MIYILPHDPAPRARRRLQRDSLPRRSRVAPQLHGGRHPRALVHLADLLVCSLQLADGPAYYGVLEQNFQSILAFPFDLFNVNNYGNPATVSNATTHIARPGLGDGGGDDGDDGMPPQFYTTASLVAPWHVYVFDRAMYVAFLVLQGVALVFLWLVFGVVLFGRGQLPKVSAFPLFDIKYKVRVVEQDEEMAEVDINKVIEVMKDAVVVSTGRRKRAETI